MISDMLMDKPEAQEAKKDKEAKKVGRPRKQHASGGARSAYTPQIASRACDTFMPFQDSRGGIWQKRMHERFSGTT